MSYSVGPDGRRYFDTAELIRAYGSLHAVAHLKPSEIAQVCTPQIAHPDTPITEATALRLIAAIERLVEIEERKLLLEHRPEVLQLKAAPEPKHEPADRKPVQSFADLLAGLED
ncbi:hypothetical protein GCM10027514_02090 [Azotobacter armeniacus]